ncbi:acyltransferase [Bifidobacterium sp. ESL0704]|uniref:acyltransferase family protein n=1 Tax=Bifidobacterium sp. ESL0704 TaxID=2983219 RepID=UPI0023F7D8B7|nr:acyltransferase [Bifidobacterium sp. ESL0704]WEV52724.1 acyltransferase [Bifidobacterium sp. ESL0704]
MLDPDSKPIPHPDSRELNIEILRIVSMLLIVACHAVVFIPWLGSKDAYEPSWGLITRWVVVQYGQVGVTIFFLITGFFLSKRTFSKRRIFKVWFQTFCYSALILIAVVLIKALKTAETRTPDSLTFWQPQHLVPTILQGIFPFIEGSYWFVTAYIVLILLSPFLNSMAQHVAQSQFEKLILLLFFFAIWATFKIRYYTPWNSYVYAILIYLIGCWLQMYPNALHAKVQSWKLCVACVFCTIIMFPILHIIYQHSTWLTLLFQNPGTIQSSLRILPIIIGTAVFILVRRIDMRHAPEVLKKCILKISSATFGVYLLHQHPLTCRFVWAKASALFPSPDSAILKALTFVVIVILMYLTLTLLASFLDTLIIHPATKIIIRHIKVDNK